jgi:hypothetical protein
MRHKPRNGFPAITSILIITAVLIGAGLVLNARLRNQYTAYTLNVDALQASAAAESCLQEGILRLQQNHSYTGGQLNVGPSSCTIQSTVAGAVYTLVAQGTANSAHVGLEMQLQDQSGQLIPLQKRFLP